MPIQGSKCGHVKITKVIQNNREIKNPSLDTNKKQEQIPFLR